MKALVTYRDGNGNTLAERDLETPSPGDDEVLIRAEAVGVNFADVLTRRRATDEIVPGLEVAGQVVDKGAGASTEVGERVVAFCGQAGYAEYVTAPDRLTWPVPGLVDMAQAVCVPTVGVTAYNLLTHAARLQSGESVLIHAAAGAVGSSAVRFARMLGASQVIGTVGSDWKREAAEQAGCTDVINYAEEDFKKRVLEITDGQGAAVILDAVGGEVFDEGLACLAKFGRIVTYGRSGGGSGSPDPRQFHQNNQTLIGYSTRGCAAARPEIVDNAAKTVLGHLENGSYNFLIGGHYRFAEGGKAHADLEERRTIGKLVLLP